MFFFGGKNLRPDVFSWGLVFINAFKVEQLPEAEISSKGSPLRPSCLCGWWLGARWDSGKNMLCCCNSKLAVYSPVVGKPLYTLYKQPVFFFHCSDVSFWFWTVLKCWVLILWGGFEVACLMFFLKEAGGLGWWTLPEKLIRHIFQGRIGDAYRNRRGFARCLAMFVWRWQLVSWIQLVIHSYLLSMTSLHKVLILVYT